MQNNNITSAAAATTSNWSNRQGRRDRQANAVLVTEDGAMHLFYGPSVEGVCASERTSWKKNGKWSAAEFSIVHRASTSFVHWMDDWDTGETLPSPSWEAGFRWMQSQARIGRMSFHRANPSGTATASRAPLSA